MIEKMLPLNAPLCKNMDVFYEFVTPLSVCSVLCTRLASPNYEVVRVIQPGLQPQTVDNPSLDSGCPGIIFKARQRGIHANYKRRYHTQTTLQQIQIQQTKSEGQRIGAPN